ncbi:MULTISPECIES: NAD(P)H-binding protein [Enterococcus]|uniref:NAD(P)-binding domain-containing protein n=1 Tax=Candidatus Enterococcus ferrettii TaxID=2815324 RepID=A0ABV0EPR8_9ENTE|nr:NAD(P)H-binding protein [Enterococcus sp. 665A]MBO1342573.1 NAD(P)H-binding protein [Enterococcus sp. 665A]
MKVFVAGATGRVAQLLIENLVEKGHFVYAGARRENEIPMNDQVKPVHLDLHDDVADLAKTLGDAEAIYFVAGSRGKDLLQTDLYGAVKLMQAAEQEGIGRYIQLSSLFALVPENWSDSILNYNIAKYFSDSWLINNTDLDYTIIQPGSLKEETGSGNITTSIEKRSENSIENVAAVLAEVLERPNTYQKVIMMGDGDTPIDEALAAI